MASLAGLSLNERKLIVGIDFGTTFSGIAWAETRRSDHQSVIESWPSSIGTLEGMSSVKVPTELRYSPDGIEWGFQIPPTVERHQWFKLGLADGRATAAGEKDPETLTTDYLTQLCKHLMYTLEQKVGASILRTIPLEFCLTVPAIWSETAKEKTLKACQKAGLKSKAEILLVSEPEAAAIYALHGLDPHGLSVGETFVLCDAGGGTVDLISYTITALYPILKVKEAAAGTGALCGSTFLNRRFGDFLSKKLGEEPGWDEEVLAEAMERFDSVIKKQYSPTSKDGYTVPVPGLANNPKLGIRRGKLTVKPEEMKGIFEPIVTKIIDLVRGQMLATNKAVRSVLLVGGFGQNNYLKERIRASLGRTITVLQPPNAWTAIVRGAVMMGLANANSSSASVGIESRAARKHYGVEMNIEYNPTIHHESQRFWCERYFCWRVHAMSWFITKGQSVEENKPHQITFVFDHPVDSGKPKVIPLQLWCDSESPVAPVHRNANVRVLATLEADLSPLSYSDLAATVTTHKDSKKYYVTPGAVEATFYSASTKYVLLCQGKRYDTVTAEYV